MHYLAIAILNSTKEEKEKLNLCRQNKDDDGLARLFSHYEESVGKAFDSLREGGNFDSWIIDNVDTVEWLYNNYDNLVRYPGAILTPDNEWIREPWDENYAKNKKLLEEYDQKMYNLVKQYKENGIVVYIDIHS